VRLLPADLKFLARTPIIPAEDSEIMGRFTGYVTIADIIADDQSGRVICDRQKSASNPPPSRT